MQVKLKLAPEIYKKPDREDGIGQYKIKVYVYPIGLYLSCRFMLFKPQSGQYDLYPNSTKDQYQHKWIDNFELSKKTDFYNHLLEEVIVAVEEETGLTITRRGMSTYES